MSKQAEKIKSNWGLPVNGVLVSFADIGHRASHNMVGSRIHMIVMVSVHGVVHMGRMM